MGQGAKRIDKLFSGTRPMLSSLLKENRLRNFKATREY